MTRLLLVCVLSSIAAVGAAVAQTETGAEDGTDPAAEERRRSLVYARVGSTKITVGEIEDAIAQQPFVGDRYRDKEALKEFADRLVDFELRAQEAERRNYGDNPLVVRSMKKGAVQQLIRREFDERITAESIPQDDVQAYYDSHREEFVRPEMVRASHILVASQAEARRLTTEARTADARAFRQLARQHSIDTETKLRGGDLRFFTRDGRPAGARQDDPPVDEQIVAAAFALRDVGDVAPAPLRLGDNWSVVKLTGRRDPQERTIEQASAGIRTRLWRERRQQAIDDFVAELRRRHEPEIFADRMTKIELDPIEPAAGLPPAHAPGPRGPGAIRRPHPTKMAPPAPM